MFKTLLSFLLELFICLSAISSIASGVISRPVNPVPQIILKGKLIGGYDQLRAHFNKEQEDKDVTN